jgi:hypothetical protein
MIDAAAKPDQVLGRLMRGLETELIDKFAIVISLRARRGRRPCSRRSSWNRGVRLDARWRPLPDTLRLLINGPTAVMMEFVLPVFVPTVASETRSISIRSDVTRLVAMGNSVAGWAAVAQRRVRRRAIIAGSAIGFLLGISRSSDVAA